MSDMTQAEFNRMLRVAIATMTPGGFWESKWTGEEIDALLGGRSLVIAGTYPSYAALAAALPNGAEGAYQVEDTRDVYTWNASTKHWDNLGQLRGPAGRNGYTYRPDVSEAGVISWENDGNLPNPEPVNLRGPQGKQGIQGPPGRDAPGFDVLGIYPTAEALEAAHPAGEEGQAYAVGTTDNNEIYIWDVDLSQWRSIGRVQGPPGTNGPAGDDGKSAYQYAVDGGYTGTEAEFQALMGSGPWVPATPRQHVYVAKTGSDTDGNGSEAAPYLTIQKAIDSIGAAINVPVFIRIGPGTYDEHVTVTHIFGDVIEIQGSTNSDGSSATKIKSFTTYGNNSNLIVNDIEMLGPLFCRSSASISLKNVLRTTNSAADELGAFRFLSCQTAHLVLCKISNQNYAIHAVGSLVYLSECTGENNNVSIWSGSGWGGYGAIVMKGHSEISGTEIKEYGGQIF